MQHKLKDREGDREREGGKEGKLVLSGKWALLERLFSSLDSPLELTLNTVDRQHLSADYLHGVVNYFCTKLC